jgi:D-3-phosphoglycerate dehydrogenase
MPIFKVLYYTTMQYQQENLELMKKLFDVAELPSPDEDTVEVLSDIDMLFAPLGYHVSNEKLVKCEKLKVIVSNTTGVPHIDMDAARQRGVKVFSLKDEQDFLVNITPTAEHAFGLILGLIRHTPWAHESVLTGEWNRRPYGAQRMLSRMSLGIVGYGRLGQMVARYGLAFGMKVFCYDPFIHVSEEGVCQVASLSDLVKASDVVTLHVPANSDTHHLINRPVLDEFKQGSYLVNTARGELVDEEALLDVLTGNRLAGAALDVLDGEFEPDFNATQNPLVKYAHNNRNLLLTPHIGGSTFDAWRETEKRVIDMAIKFFYP